MECSRNALFVIGRVEHAPVEQNGAHIRVSYPDRNTDRRSHARWECPWARPQNRAVLYVQRDY